MFEKATRKKLRFETPVGHLSVEDLWDLPLQGRGANLDDVAKGLYRKLKDYDETSFVTKSKAKDDTLQMKFDIVKHVIDIKLGEAEAADLARVNKEKKQKILSIIASKQDEKLASSSIDELQKLAESL